MSGLTSNFFNPVVWKSTVINGLMNDKTPGKLRNIFRLQIERANVEGTTTRTSKYQKIDQINLKAKK